MLNALYTFRASDLLVSNLCRPKVTQANELEMGAFLFAVSCL
jgi:hypothetical protein